MLRDTASFLAIPFRQAGLGSRAGGRERGPDGGQTKSVPLSEGRRGVGKLRPGVGGQVLQGPLQPAWGCVSSAALCHDPVPHMTYLCGGGQGVTKGVQEKACIAAVPIQYMLRGTLHARTQLARPGSAPWDQLQAWEGGGRLVAGSQGSPWPGVPQRLLQAWLPSRAPGTGCHIPPPCWRCAYRWPGRLPGGCQEISLRAGAGFLLPPPTALVEETPVAGSSLVAFGSCCSCPAVT